MNMEVLIYLCYPKHKFPFLSHGVCRSADVWEHQRPTSWSTAHVCMIQWHTVTCQFNHHPNH